MRHRRVGRKLGVVTKHRTAMLRNLTMSLFRHDSIKTTDMRAKEVRRFAEKLITMAKKGTLQHRRQAASHLKDKEVLKKLFSEIAEKNRDRPGGYTRIVKLGFRKGDGAPISLVELIQDKYRTKSKKKGTKVKAKTETGKKDSSSVKSNKKESAKELGLVENTLKDSDAKTMLSDKDVRDDVPVESMNVTDQSSEKKVFESEAGKIESDVADEVEIEEPKSADESPETSSQRDEIKVTEPDSNKQNKEKN